MNVFDSYLRRLELTLDIPYPKRRELLDVVSAHLNDLFDEYRASGMTERDAANRALTTMSIDEEFLTSISEIHRTALSKALSKLPSTLSFGLEFSAISLVGVCLVLTVIKEASMIEFITNGGFFMIPINLAGGAILLLGLERIYSLFIKKDHSTANLSKRILSLKYLAYACVLTGIIGTLMGFYEAFAAAEIITKQGQIGFPIYEVAKIAMTTSIWGGTLALLSRTFLFVIEAKGANIKRQHLS